MKKAITLILLLATLSGLTAEIISNHYFSGEAFEYRIIRSADLHPAENSDNLDFRTEHTFFDSSSSYEIRYFSSSQIDAEISSKELRKAAAIEAQLILLNLAGNEDRILSGSAFADNDVRTEFNGDFGYACTLKNGLNSYVSDYRYASVNFYFKIGVGMVCQIILFNDINVYKALHFIDNFHSFQFL